MSLLYIDLEWTFSLEHAGACVFERDITVHLAVDGLYGSEEITGWTIDDISIEGWDSKNKRPTRHYLPMDSDAAKLIVSELNKDKSFDAFVRERALEQAREAA